jgi:nucleotide-binding universal stress UspA family protein
VATKKKILIPMDGSKSAIRALRFAAKTFDAVLLVLNVQPELPSGRRASKAMIAEHQRRAADDALAPARAFIKRSKIEARVETAIGDPASTLVAFAKRHRCLVIVMGSRGRGRIATFMLGSIATKVIYLAACPVTIVK